jgi:hypothetical protein
MSEIKEWKMQNLLYAGKILWQTLKNPDKFITEFKKLPIIGDNRIYNIFF